MLRRLLDSRSFVAALLAMTTGTALYCGFPFPEHQLFLELIGLRAPRVLATFRYLYWLSLFSLPYMLFAGAFSALYIFTMRWGRLVTPGQLPPYPDPLTRRDLFLVLGEIHNPRAPGPAAFPRWLVVPERGLFTGIAVFGAVGSGKTSSCLYPFADQILRYQSGDKNRRIGGLILEVKGDFCHRIREILEGCGRGDDYIEISLDSEYRYNPLHNDLDAYALAFNIASLLNNLFGRGKEPFWQQAYTNLVKFIILLYKVAYGYVTLFDVYHCAISPPFLEQRINEAEEIILGRQSIALPPVVYGDRIEQLAGLGFAYDADADRYLAPAIPELRQTLRNLGIPYESRWLRDPRQAEPDKLDQLEAVKRWFDEDWRRIEPKLRASIVEGISVFLSLFDDNPKVKKVFCPKPECFDPARNAANQFGKPLPSFSWLIEQGKICALNFPIGMNPGLAKALGVMLKLDFERAVLNRVAEMEAHPERHRRQVLFLCDEYQHFATVGENDPTGDEKFLSLSRQPKCIPIIATQSISSLRSALPGESWRTLLQTFRTKIFLTLSDDFSARTASELCGREDRFKVSYNLAEAGHNARVSLFTGKPLSHKANITASKSYNMQSDFRFDMKTFTELRNAQSVAIAYDGVNPMPPAFCYLKPYYNDPNKSYFQQLQEGAL
jgi:hypothetical protein